MADLVDLGNRLIDRLLRVDPTEVLNAGLPLPAPENPARALRQAANSMRSEAFDPETSAVDYARLAHSPAYARFQELTRTLPLCRLNDLGDRSDRLAFWINLYNALVIDAVIRYRVSGSISSRPGLFRRAAYNIGGMRFSADDIEHGVLRGNRHHPRLAIRPFSSSDPRQAAVIRPPDPRVHFALVCGARSCPSVAFYDGDRLESQLDDAVESFLRGGGARYDPRTRTLWLSRIFLWYRGDFGGRQGVLALVRRYMGDPLTQSTLAQGRLRIRYLPYDWSVNAVLQMGAASWSRGS